MNDVGAETAAVFKEHWARAVAALARVTRDLTLAEDAVADAFTTALRRWPETGVPDRPLGWILTTARNRAIDVLRREKRHAEKLALVERLSAVDEMSDIGDIPDDRLALMFACCHPALAEESRLALTLKCVAGLSTREIARAFVVGEAALAQRLVRAKRKIRDAGIPLQVPEGQRLGERLPSVLRVVYLVFNEGYVASGGDGLVRRDLCDEAMRLGDVLVALMPDEAEALGLQSLMLLQDARAAARLSPAGELVVLEQQDRSLWNRDSIGRALDLLRQASRLDRAGPYQLQAAIAAVHCVAPTADDTNWRAIVSLYDELLAFGASAVVELNRAFAVSMVEGPAVALALVDEVAASGRLDSYHLLHVTRADLLERLGRRPEAADALRRGASLTRNRAERALLQGRLAAITASQVLPPDASGDAHHMTQRQALADQHERVYQALIDLEQRQGSAREDELAEHTGLDAAQVSAVLRELIHDKDLVTELPPDAPDLGPRYTSSDRPS